METIRGYEIQKAILFETGHGIALGRAKTGSEKFKVWSFTETASGRDYYRGSCPGSREAAEEMDTGKKASGYWTTGRLPEPIPLVAARTQQPCGVRGCYYSTTLNLSLIIKKFKYLYIRLYSFGSSVVRTQKAL